MNRQLHVLINEVKWNYHIYATQFAEKKLTAFYGDNGEHVFSVC